MAGLALPQGTKLQSVSRDSTPLTPHFCVAIKEISQGCGYSTYRYGFRGSAACLPHPICSLLGGECHDPRCLFGPDQRAVSRHVPQQNVSVNLQLRTKALPAIDIDGEYISQHACRAKQPLLAGGAFLALEVLLLFQHSRSMPVERGQIEQLDTVEQSQVLHTTRQTKIVG